MAIVIAWPSDGDLVISQTRSRLASWSPRREPSVNQILEISAIRPSIEIEDERKRNRNRALTYPARRDHRTDRRGIDRPSRDAVDDETGHAKEDFAGGALGEAVEPVGGRFGESARLRLGVGERVAAFEIG